MKAKASDDAKAPPIVRMLNAFGAAMQPPRAGVEWEGGCPLCGKERHLFANPEKETWHCKVCGKGGNRVNFLEGVHKQALATTTAADLQRLSEHRSIPVEVLKAHAVAYHRATRRWLIPGRAAKGTMHDLRRYDAERKVMMSTAGCNSQLMGAVDLAKAREGSRVWVCEGEWDGMAMRWLLDSAKASTDVVVAVPGAGVLKNDWAPLFQGKHTVACYDHDEAGRQGAEKAAKLLKGSRSLKFIHWPDAKPKGWDVRDHVKTLIAKGPKKALAGLVALLKDHAPGQQSAAAVDAQEEIGEPALWPEVLSTFESTMLMTPDLRRALIVSLATCVSNDIGGDPLWVYIVGPPGAGKTLLLTALNDTKRCIFRSTVTPHSLVSGWRGDGATDPSLIPKLKGLTLVAKDFTEVLSMPQMAQDEIFSTLRGAYDGVVQKSFGNGVMREYTDCRFAILAGVTNAIHGAKMASLGERFIKVQLSKMEGDAADAVVRAAMASVGKEREVEDTLKKVTTRFLYRKMDPLALPVFTQEFATRLTALVQLIAMLRAQVDRDKFSQDMLYRPAPEAGTRLAKQLTKLGMSIAHVLGKSEVNAEVYEVVEHVAFDTGHGWSLDVVDALMRLGGEGTRIEAADIAGVPVSTLARRFDDLQALGAVSPCDRKVSGGRPATVYRVSPAVQDLWMRSKGEQSWSNRRSPGTTRPSPRIVIRSKKPSSSSSVTSVRRLRPR